jgi:hypothetical protein
MTFHDLFQAFITTYGLAIGMAVWYRELTDAPESPVAVSDPHYHGGEFGD